MAARQVESRIPRTRSGRRAARGPVCLSPGHHSVLQLVGKFGQHLTCWARRASSPPPADSAPRAQPSRGWGGGEHPGSQRPSHRLQLTPLLQPLQRAGPDARGVRVPRGPPPAPGPRAMAAGPFLTSSGQSRSSSQPPACLLLLTPVITLTTFFVWDFVVVCALFLESCYMCVCVCVCVWEALGLTFRSPSRPWASVPVITTGVATLCAPVGTGVRGGGLGKLCHCSLPECWFTQGSSQSQASPKCGSAWAEPRAPPGSRAGTRRAGPWGPLGASVSYPPGCAGACEGGA